MFNKILRREVKTTLGRVKSKALQLGGIPLEIFVLIGKMGFDWLTRFLNKVSRTKLVLDKWRNCIVVPLYENKRDI